MSHIKIMCNKYKIGGAEFKLLQGVNGWALDGGAENLLLSARKNFYENIFSIFYWGRGVAIAYCGRQH